VACSFSTRRSRGRCGRASSQLVNTLSTRRRRGFRHHGKAPMSLWSDFLEQADRPAWKWTHYMAAYERHLARYVNQSVTLLEIGCGQGGSLQLWKKYLGPFAQIVGVDIDPACEKFAESQIEIRIGDQSDSTFLGALVEECDPLDVVLDYGTQLTSDGVAA